MIDGKEIRPILWRYIIVAVSIVLMFFYYVYNIAYNYIGVNDGLSLVLCEKWPDGDLRVLNTSVSVCIVKCGAVCCALLLACLYLLARVEICQLQIKCLSAKIKEL